MTSLQWSLLILAVVMIAAVLVYNLLQSRKTSQRIEKSREGMAAALKGSQSDLGPSVGLNDAPRPEPIFERYAESDIPVDLSEDKKTLESSQLETPLNSVDSEVNIPGPAAAQFDGISLKNLNQIDSVSSSKADSLESKAIDYKTTESPLGDPWNFRNFGLHFQADCIVEFSLRSILSAEALTAIIGPTRRVGGKPVIFEASRIENEWAPLVPGETFSKLRAGVLLANRHGPLNAMEFSDFSALMQKIADKLDIHVQLPEMQSVLQRARALDAQCAELDSQIGINVLTPEPLSTQDLATLAGEFGLMERGNNRFARIGQHGELMFSLALADVPNRLTLLLDIPRTPPASNAWEAMVDCGMRCAARQGGKLVDDFDQLLTRESLVKITQQLMQRYQALKDAQLEAGSPVSLRLFN